MQLQLAGALGHTQNALPLNDVLTNIGIDLGAVATFAFFFYKDWEVSLASSNCDVHLLCLFENGTWVWSHRQLFSFDRTRPQGVPSLSPVTQARHPTFRQNTGLDCALEFQVEECCHDCHCGCMQHS